MSTLRFKMVEAAFGKKPATVAVPEKRPSEYFGMYVFNREKMFKYLPADVYAKLINVIDTGSALDRSIADEVAAGMKKLTEREGSSRNSQASCLYSRNLTPLLSPTEASGIHSKHADILPGTRLLLPSSWMTLSASLPSS